MRESKNSPYILIVEDDPEHAELMKRSLEESPEQYTVRIAGSIAVAVDFIGQGAPMLMFVDQFLPDGNGDVLISISKGVFPVIMLTSHGHEQMAVKVIKSGALDYFPKSAEFYESVVKIVHRSLREWRLMLDKVYSEKKLSEQEAWRKEIIESAMDGFCIVDDQGRLLEVNEKYCEMSGYSKEELLHMTIFEIEAIEIQQSTIQHMNTIMIESEDRFETVHRRKDGSVFDVEISVQYRCYQGGKFITFLRDISERKTHEKEREILLLEMKNILKKTLAMKQHSEHCGSCGLLKDEITRLGKIEAHNIRNP